MSERFPPLVLGDELESRLENELTKVYGPEAGFKWKDGKGAPIGPFAVLAYVSKLDFGEARLIVFISVILQTSSHRT